MTVESAVTVHAAPPDLLQPRIRLRARGVGEAAWHDVPVMFASSISEHPHGGGGCEGWAYCDAAGPIECEVTFADPIMELRIRPSQVDPVPFETAERTTRFVLDRPRYVVVESGGMRADTGRPSPRYTLYVLADPPEVGAPEPHQPGVRTLEPGLHDTGDFDPGSDEVVYLLPGVHNVRGQMIDLHPHKTLYLAGGAHLRSYVRGESADGAAILGRGVIDGTAVACKSREWRDDGDAGFVFLRRGHGITIDGPVIYNSPFWNIVTFGTTGTRIRHHKAITWNINNDGVQPRSCNNMLVEHCFLKCADDCIAVKTRRAAGMTSRNLVFRDLVLWNDVPGNGMEIGHTSQADLLEQVLFEDIQLVHCDTRSENDGFAISITLIDHCTVQDVTYRRINVEGVRSGDVRLKVGVSRYTTDDERGRIRRIRFEDLHFDGPMRHSRLEGYDAEHGIDDVTFHHIVSESGGPGDPRICRSLADLGAAWRHARDITITASQG